MAVRLLHAAAAKKENAEISGVFHRMLYQVDELCYNRPIKKAGSLQRRPGAYIQAINHRIY